MRLFDDGFRLVGAADVVRLLPNVRSMEELGDSADDRLLLLLGEFREDRQGQRFFGGQFGLGQIALPPAEVFETLLHVERNGIVDLRADAARGEVLPQGVALATRCADHKLIPDMPAAGFVSGHGHVAGEIILGEELLVAGGVDLSRGGPGIKMRQLHAEHRGLQRVEATVDAHNLMVVARLHAVHAEELETGRDVVAGGRKKPAVADAAEVLRGIEAETPDVADRAGAATVPGRQNRLGGILDHRKASGLRDRQDRIHVGGASKQMDGDDRLRPLADLLRHVGRVDQIGDRIDVGEDRHRAESRDGAGGGEEGVAGQDHLVARLDVKGHQRQEQGVAAGGARDHVRHAERLREFGFQVVNVWAEHEFSGVADTVEGTADRVAEHGILTIERQQGHGGQKAAGIGAAVMGGRGGAADGRGRGLGVGHDVQISWAGSAMATWQAGDSAAAPRSNVEIVTIATSATVKVLPHWFPGTCPEPVDCRLAGDRKLPEPASRAGVSRAVSGGLGGLGCDGWFLKV